MSTPLTEANTDGRSTGLAVSPGSEISRFFPPTVVLHVACNDGDNGCFAGKADAVEIEFGRDLYDRLSFSPNYFDWSPAFTVDYEKKTLRLGGRKIAFASYGAHVGNWCWDCFRIGREDAAALITWAKFRKWFSLDEAPTEIWDAYSQNDAGLTAAPNQSKSQP